MAGTDQEALVYRLADEVWNRGELATVDELFAPTFVDHSYFACKPAADREGYKAGVAQVRRAFPDLVLTIEDLLADREALAVRCSLHGTNTGALPGGELPTGKEARWSCQTICHTAEGRVTALWVIMDRLALREQLGLR